MSDPGGLPLVSVVMPVRNEGSYLAASFDALERQTYPRDRIEILVVDGGSTDGTRDMVRDRAATDARIRLLGGPGVNTPAAMNVGAAATTGTYIAKVDGHGYVNPDFLAVAVGVLESDPAIGCVGGVIVPIATTSVQRAIQAARFSVLGVGVGIYTAAPVRHDIDTVQCGVYRRDVLEAIGGFDPALQFGEDEEVNFRVRASGRRIVYEPAMAFRYHVRPTLGSLFRQYHNYGRARVAVVRKHPSFLRPKHLAPSALLVALAVTAVTCLVAPWPAVVAWGGYAGGLVVAGIALGGRHRQARPDLIALALACLHLGYGLGMLRGLGDRVRSSR
jgi:glycosyltransferase involved in cell wall biosynthesis